MKINIKEFVWWSIVMGVVLPFTLWLVITIFKEGF
jgi:hypothetical protein